MARPRMCILSDLDMRDVLIRYSIDRDTGEKVSNRKIILDKDFQIRTGLKGKNGNPPSLGTLSKWLKICKLDEEIIFNEGRKRGWIPNTIEFKDWSNVKERPKTGILQNEDVTVSEKDIWNKIKNHLGMKDISLDVFSIDEVKNTLHIMGYTDKQLELLYNHYKN